MNYSDIKTRILEILAEYTRQKSDNINEDTQLYKDLQLDSLDCIQLGLKLENQFNIQIPDIDIDRIETVGEIIQIIQRLQEKQQNR